MRKVLTVIIAVILLYSACFADFDVKSVEDAVPDSVRDTVGTIEDVADTESFFERLVSSAKDTASEVSGGIIRKAVSVILIAILCSVLGIFSSADVPKYVSMCGCLAVSLLCVYDSNAYIGHCTDAIHSISLFSKTLLPALCTLSAACGQISSSAVRYVGSVMFMNLFISLAENIILPLVYAYLATSIAASAFDNSILSGISGLIKSITKTLMTVFAVTFTLYIGISGAIASSGDAVATRLTKTAISTALPVVGGIISDAASSIVAGAELIKNTVGAFGMISVLSICLIPVVTLGLNFIIFKAASVGVSAFGVPKLAGLASNIGTAFGMLLGLVGCCGVMMFISIISCMRAVVS